MIFFPESQRSKGNGYLSNLVLKIKATRLMPKYIYWILLMCALRAHNNFHFWKKISWELKKY